MQPDCPDCSRIFLCGAIPLVDACRDALVPLHGNAAAARSAALFGGAHTIMITSESCGPRGQVDLRGSSQLTVYGEGALNRGSASGISEPVRAGPTL